MSRPEAADGKVSGALWPVRRMVTAPVTEAVRMPLPRVLVGSLLRPVVIVAVIAACVAVS